MKRREFLRYAAGAILTAWTQPECFAGAELKEIAEPKIYKRFFQFDEYVKRPSTDIIVVHHAGMSVDKDTTAQGIHLYHKRGNHWAGIGYHYLIRKNGMIEQGRQPNVVGAHAYGHNMNSVGICLAGNYNLANPPKEQMDALKHLTAWLCKKYELDPTKSGVIVGHRNLCDTDCPGKNLYRRIGELRLFCREYARG